MDFKKDVLNLNSNAQNLPICNFDAVVELTYWSTDKMFL